ncbi:uncharacterized protein LOC109808621 isoform X2 [Cajanus cajan]|uniref:uncharacterized protein LOC109808621 isoform X2 n=1 Tax=Cajanus cajan TaxID=3821 RepID=UPI0010FB697B|nr:uncharacterized protein LOC109808621 isoform X2 [Cajanus cajan]
MMSFHVPQKQKAMSLLLAVLIHSLFRLTRAESKKPCRSSCGDIPIEYPFGIDDGCGSPYYRYILVCSESGKLEVRTPSGKYPVHNVSYDDPHIIVTDPFMWSCEDGENYRPTRPFSLDTSTRFKLSPHNEYLFFNCSQDDVIVKPKPILCERFPEHCDSSCDSGSYLCRHMPGCSFSFTPTSCCSYYPTASESLRLMLKYCTSYTSVYWRNDGAPQPYYQLPQYGIRIDFDIPVTTRCLQCQDPSKGAGTCGFDTQTQSFMCLCKDGNFTTHCKDYDAAQHNRKVHVIAGTVTAVSAAGAFGIGAGIWYLKKVLYSPVAVSDTYSHRGS